MVLEIERRFIVNGEGWRDFVISTQTIRQGYLSTDLQGWVVRIRIIDNKKSLITLKSSLNEMISNEFEYMIPIQDAEFIWNNLVKKITKNRYFLKLSKGIWVVDVFTGKNSPLKIAEVELEKEESKFIMPNWCGKEVTAEKSLTNASLAEYPLKDWSTPEKKYFEMH